MGRRVCPRIARHVCLCRARFARTSCTGAAPVSRARSARYQAALLHANTGGIFFRLRGARAARGWRDKTAFAGCADLLFVLWLRLRADDAGGKCFFPAAGAFDSAACAGEAAHAATAALVGPAAQPSRAGSQETSR